MDDNIFSQKKERELQNLRQRSASNVVRVDPNLRGFLDRFNPDVSRETLLQAQRARVPTKEELEKSVGVKTAKKLKKRRGKNLRGEVARNLREQRRFERGERRDRPEDEPRIVGDPIPPAPGAPAAPAADPNAQLRLAIEGRRIAAQDAQQRRLVDLLAVRDDRERQERQAILDRGLAERGAILDIGIRDRDAARAERQALEDVTRQERQAILDLGLRERIQERDAAREERDAILDRNFAEGVNQRAERAQILDRAEAERLELRGAFREILRGETTARAQERQDILDQAEAERERLRIAGSEERTALERQARIERERILTERGAEVQELAQIRERVEQQAAAERAQDRQEREELLGQLVNLTAEERREREAREEREAAQQVEERQRAREERERIDTQAAQEREGILRLTLDPTLNPREGGEQAQADRDFLQRQFQQGLETIERRIGESEARTQEQIRQHADRVAAIERQPPIVVQQPAPAPAGPSAADIAASVRQALESPRRRERRLTQRTIDIEEQTTDTEDEDFSPTASARRRQAEGRGAESPQPPIGFEPGGEEGGFSPVQSPRTQRTPQSTGIDPVPPFVSEAEAAGEPEPAPAPTSPRRSPRARAPRGKPTISRGTQTADTGGISAVRGGTDVEGVGGVVAEPARLPSERIPELEGSGVLVDPANLPQEGFGEEGFGGGVPREGDLFQSGQFAGDIMAAGQNAIGYVGGIAGDANQRLGDLFGRAGLRGFPAVAPGVQQGGALRDPEGNPIFGLGQDIEPQEPRLRPLQSQQPARRIAPVETDATRIQNIEREIQADQTRLRSLQREARAGIGGGRFDSNTRVIDELQREIARKGRIIEGIRARRGEEPTAIQQARLEQQAQIRRPQPAAGRAQQVGAGLVESEEEASALGLGRQSDRNANFRLFESISDEIDAYYTRGRAQGGARGVLPFQIVNTTDRRFKNLNPGQAVALAQVESNGTLGYYPSGQVAGSKAGITRIGRGELIKQIKAGKLKIDRSR